MHVPPRTFSAEWAEVEDLKAKSGQDRYGRKFVADQRCVAPFHAVKVTGALFHTQGGLAIDASGRVKRKDGTLFPNLFAAGGAAAGVSGATRGGLSVGKRTLDRDRPWPVGGAIFRSGVSLSLSSVRNTPAGAVTLDKIASRSK